MRACAHLCRRVQVYHSSRGAADGGECVPAWRDAEGARPLGLTCVDVKPAWGKPWRGTSPRRHLALPRHILCQPSPYGSPISCNVLRPTLGRACGVATSPMSLSSPLPASNFVSSPSSPSPTRRNLRSRSLDERRQHHRRPRSRQPHQERLTSIPLPLPTILPWVSIRARPGSRISHRQRTEVEIRPS